MTTLSVNINKIATLRNSRGGNVPDLIRVALDCERFGAQGITVHPRPDERHVRYSDVRELKRVVATELNVEGNPVPSFMELVLEVLPAQVTLVPDAPGALTSSAGWDAREHRGFLQDICGRLREAGIRSSIFLDPEPEMVAAAAECGCDRVELYTESFASRYAAGDDAARKAAVQPYIDTAIEARRAGLGLNAGHDLSLENLRYFADLVPGLLEVSIGHALIADALYLGLDRNIDGYFEMIND
jgi:pyridoxine 5-phosphate synthase